MFIATTGATQVGEGFLVDAKVPHRGAVFGSHVCDGGPIGDGKRGSAFAEGLDKLAGNRILRFIGCLVAIILPWYIGFQVDHFLRDHTPLWTYWRARSC
jgi:hypothetical protein